MRKFKTKNYIACFPCSCTIFVLSAIRTCRFWSQDQHCLLRKQEYHEEPSEENARSMKDQDLATFHDAQTEVQAHASIHCMQVQDP